MDSIHIERDYSAHKKSVVRPYDEYVKFEIFSFDPKYTATYIREDNTLKNGKNTTKTSWKRWSCYKSTDKQNDMIFTLKYNVLVAGEYQIDLLYEQCNYIHNSKTDTSKDLLGHLKIGNVFDEDILFDGENNISKRNTTFVNLGTGAKTITINVPHNCYFFGVIIRKVIKFIGDNYYGSALGSEEGNMVLTSATLTNSDMIKATELSCSVIYDPHFECEDTESGFYIDYRNECNFYVKDDTNTIKRVFGGYVSSILPNSDRTSLTIACGDRLTDGQNRYLLDQMRLGGGTNNLSDTGYSKKNSKDFENYPQALKYLCDTHETTLKSNISKAYTVDGETFHDGFVITFGKNKKIKKITTSNGEAKSEKNYILLRNKPSSNKKQVWTLYDASKHAKKPINITKYPYLHITYGLGATKTEYKTKITEKVDNSETTAGSQKFTKCGVSQDGKYIMAIGKPSAGKDSMSGWTKTVFERKCPHCGSTNLVWDIDYGSWGYASCRGASEGGGIEGHIFCKGCDADYSCQGHEHISGSKYSLKKVSQTVASSKSEKDKLRSGNMVAVPSTAVTITPDDVFKAITKIAFKYKYNLSSGASSYSAMKKSGKGECWAFSDLIFTELKKYGVSCKIVQYATNESGRHRSVLYKNEKGKWVDFPYREYGWGTRYNNMLNNTSSSKHGAKIAEYKGHSIGNVKSSTSNTRSQTTTITNTKGYDKDKPFKGYLKLTYSLAQDFKAKKYSIDIKFTYNATQNNSINTGLNLYWVNNTIKKATLKLANNKTLIDFLKTIHGENSKIYLQSIQMIAPARKSTKENEEVDWYKSDKSTNDNSSCKLNLYQISFDDNADVDPSDLQSCGKSINSMLKEIVDSAGYYVNMEYGLHRKDDVINFRVVNNSTPAFIASEGDNNNILSWNSITYSPIGNLFNMSVNVFKKEDGSYNYIETGDALSILKYGEQCTLLTNNNAITEKEAYFNATQNEKFNPNQQYSYTITVPNYPNIKIGDLVKVVANTKTLNSVKEIKSVKLVFDNSKIPRIQTTIGLDELAPDIQLQKNIRNMKNSAKKESTEFSSSATPVTSEIYYEWDR